MKAPATIPYFLKEQIRELIVDGTFRPGQPLREQELEQRFGTSRSPIREALRLLELSGLVVHLQRKGFRIRRYTEDEIRDIFLLRAELASYSIAQLAGQPDLVRLLRALKDHDAVLARTHAARDVVGYINALRAFYLACARYTDNVPLADTLDRLTEQVEPLRFNLLRHQLADIAYDTYHSGIAEALGQGELNRAAQVARDRVQEMLGQVLHAYAQVVVDVADDEAEERLRAY
ncbi:GntR family transcriptional regulator [Bordetella genomosp. 5]|uniref:GntR family transcriptional regulator n=1 Tax=Bordetella genomosp. 5 TaxID=1395608 RepID=UPI003F7F58F8